jgi:hypothetical protein
MGENMQAHVQSVRNLPISLHRGDVRSIAETLNVGNVRRLAAINHNLVQNDMFCVVHCISGARELQLGTTYCNSTLCPCRP